LQLKFRNDQLVPDLELLMFPHDTLVPLELSGAFLDGTPFSATDCVRLVGPSMAVSSSVSGAWIEVTPPDEFGNTGGLAPFGLAYPAGSVVTFTAPDNLGEWIFQGWTLDGGPWSTETSIDVTVESDHHTIEPLYLRRNLRERPIRRNDPGEEIERIDDESPLEDFGE